MVIGVTSLSHASNTTMLTVVTKIVKKFISLDLCSLFG